jgi:hypothetical protein
MLVKTTTNSLTTTAGDHFMIHAKHGCDKCCTHPIIGKRYTSQVENDFDLCATCYKVRDEEHHGDFLETVSGEICSVCFKLRIDYVCTNS